MITSKLKTLLSIFAMLLYCFTASAATTTFDDWTSTNTANGSTSQKTYTFVTTAGEELWFSWSVSSEANFDKLIVTLDGTQVLTKSGSESGNFTQALDAGSHTLVVKYTKDGSSSSGSDQAKVWNISIVARQSTIDGITYSYTGNSASVMSATNVSTVVIPDEVTIEGTTYIVTSIGGNAFEGCRSLTSITIPENSQLMSIGRCAFSGCSSLTAITIPENVTSIGESVFSGCSSLTIINIPERVTSIGGSAFEGCSRLTSITIPENSQLTRIERYAFYGCSSLIDINIPEGVTSIGELAFSGCSSLEYVTLNCSNVSDWFSRNTAIKEVVLGDGVATVENKAFQGCSGLTSITIGKNVTEIGELSPNSSCAVFDNCTSLKEVLFEDGSEALAVGCNNYSANVRPNSRGEGLFYDCPLEKVYLGRNLSYDTRHRQAGASPFYAKGTLTSLTIGSEVTEVGENAFSDCGLDSITCYAMVPPACYASTFAGVDTSIPVYVPETSVADYQSAEVWKDFLGFVGVDTGITPSILNPQLSTIYDLHGRRITDTEGLKGIYIVNGKKTVIK